MRILLALTMILALSGCTAMLLGASADGGSSSECSESEKEAEKRGC